MSPTEQKLMFVANMGVLIAEIVRYTRNGEITNGGFSHISSVKAGLEVVIQLHFDAIDKSTTRPTVEPSLN